MKGYTSNQAAVFVAGAFSVETNRFSLGYSLDFSIAVVCLVFEGVGTLFGRVMDEPFGLWGAFFDGVGLACAPFADEFLVELSVGFDPPGCDEPMNFGGVNNSAHRSCNQSGIRFGNGHPSIRPTDTRL